MREFFKMMLASMVGFLLASVLFSFLTLVVLAAMISLAPKEDVTVPAEAVLHIRLDMPLQDRGVKSPFDAFGSYGSTRPLGLNEVLRSLEAAAADDRIKGIYLEMGMVQGGMATLEELRNGLIRFRESGKPVIAFGDIVGQQSYFLSSMADKVYLSPKGLLDFSGLSAQVAFLKGLSEKMKVEMQVIRPSNNTYKSAVEPFMLDRMSEANREQTNRFLESIWGEMLQRVSTSRNIPVEQLNLIADSLLSINTEKAYAHGLVDGLLYHDQLLDSLRTMMGITSTDKIDMISLGRYTRISEREVASSLLKRKQPDRVAVIYATGTIMMGRGEETVISSSHMSSAIRKARKDDKVKAIVLRINSPGGDGIASEIIWREVALAAAEKPVVVSMGDLAASGGYYIAAPATKIVAQPNTLTGSIGVFGVVPNMQKMFNEHLGITFDEVKTNANSGFGNFSRPLTPFELQLLQKHIDEFYDHFLERVATGRGMTAEAVDAIGQGRVWSGVDAMELGLVDALGGLDEAIRIAAAEAGIDDYRVLELPEQVDPFTRIFRQLSGETRADGLIRKHLGTHYHYYEMMQEVGRLEGVQARLPYMITVQ